MSGEIPEKYVESHLTTRVKEKAGVAIKLLGIKGIPDRLVILPGGWIAFVELKRPKGGIVADIQTYWHKLLRKLGCRVYLLKSRPEVDNFISDYEKSQMRQDYVQ